MTYAEMTMPEFEQEMATTRRVLERVPEEKFDWKPHEKSNTIGWNAVHLTEIAGWANDVLSKPFFDINPSDGEPYRTPELKTRQAVLDAFDANVEAAKQALAQTTDEAMHEMWSLRDRGTILFEMPRLTVFRSFVLNHIIHHRAILTVYYRMNDVPVPAIYGPSGDEQM